MPNVRNTNKGDLHVVLGAGKGSFTLAGGKVTPVDDALWKEATAKPGAGLDEALKAKTVEVTSDHAEGSVAALPDGPLPEGTRPEQVAAAQKDDKARAAVSPAVVTGGSTSTVPSEQPDAGEHRTHSGDDPYRAKKK